MSFEIEKKDNYTLVSVRTPKLDANNAPDLKSEFVMLNNSGEKNIVLDLSDCQYCDSSGLRAVLVANRLCDDAIGTFMVTGLQPDVENIFKISMLHTVLIITPTVNEADDLMKHKESF